MANQQNSYTVSDGTGTGNRDFSYTFPSFLESEVKVEIDNVVKTLTTHYTIVSHNNSSGGTVRFNSTGLPNGTAGTTPVRIFRQTNVETPKAEFTAGSSLKAQEINDNFKQVRHALQETIGAAATDRKIQRFNIEADSIDGTLIADDVVNSEHIAAGAVDLEHMSANSVDSDQYVDGSIDGVHIANDQIDSQHYAAGSIDLEHMSANSVDSDQYVDGSIDRIHLEADIIDGSKIENSAVNTEHIANNAVTTNEILNGAVTSAKILDGTIVNADINTSAAIAGTKVTPSFGSQNVSTSGTAATGALTVTGNIAVSGTVDGRDVAADGTKLDGIDPGAKDDQTASEIKTLLQSDKLTASEIATGALDGRYYTEAESDARYFNISTGDTIKDGDTFPDNDTTIATTAAINDRIIDLVDDVGGFVPIANETSFPTANPDVNNGAGTLVSIKEISSTRTPSTGTVTIANGSGSNTVTITGCGSTVLTAGFGVIVETTTTLHTYAFHRLVPKATEVTTVAGKATEIGRLGTAAAIEDMSILGTADVVADLNTLGTADVVADMNMLATSDVISDMNTLAVTSVINDMDTVAGISSNVTTVAGIQGNVTTVAGISGNVTTVAGIQADVTTVAGIDSNVTTVANNNSNITSVANNMANVNNFNDRYQIDSNNPDSDGGGNALAAGDLYFNTSANELKVYNGSSWQSGVTATGNFAVVTGNTFTGDNTYNDGVEARFGGSADLKIYHHSSNGHSYIQNATGDLNLTTTGSDINITAADDVAILVQGSEYAFVGNNNGAVQIFYDNSKKFETTTAGGTFYSSRVQFHNTTSSGSYIQLSNSGTSHNSASGFWLGANSSSQGVVQNKENTDILFYTNDTEVARLTADGAFKLPDNAAIRLGGSGTDLGDLRIYHDGSNSYIKDAGAGDLIVKHGNDTGLISRTNGAVELYYDNNLVFYTNTVGIHVQGSSGENCQITMSADANADNADKFKLLVEDDGPFKIQNRASGAWETNIECNGNNNVELYYDNSKKFETTDTGTKVTTTAVNINAEVEIDATNGGQAALRLKTSKSGTNRASRIDFLNQDNTSPKWTLLNDFAQDGTNDFRLVDAGQSIGNSIRALQNGTVELYYDNGKKLETTSNGIKVTKLDVNSVNADINLTSGQNSFSRYGAISHYHNNSTSTPHNQIFFNARNGSNGRIRFFNMIGGTSTERFRIDAVDGVQTYAHLTPATDSTYNLGSSSLRFANLYADTLYGDGSNLTGINTDLVSDTSPQLGGDLDTNGNHILMDDSRIIKFGDDADLQIYHTGNHAYINNTTGNVYIRGGGSIRVQPVSGEDSVLAYANGRVHLYYDNSARLQTESWGSRCFGDSGGDTIFQVEASSSRSGEVRLIADGGANNADYSRIQKEVVNGSVHFQNLAGGTWENNLVLVNNGAVELYHDGSKTLYTNTVGAVVKGGNTSGHTEFSIHGNEGQDAVLLLAADEGDDNGDYWRILADDTGPDLWIQNYADGSWETNIRANGGSGQTELYYDSVKKFETMATGTIVTGSGNYSQEIYRNGSGNNQGRVQGWRSGSGNATEIGFAEYDSSQWFVRYDKNASNGYRSEYHWQSIFPASNNSYDLGSSSARWRNVYTNDLHLSNEGSSNDVDSTWGDWTIQEGESDLFLKNNRSGKKYKFNLTEVS